MKYQVIYNGFNVLSMSRKSFFRRDNLPKILNFTFVGLVLLILITLIQCQIQPDLGPPTETDVRFLGHKGGGDNSFGATYIENTILSVKEGLKTLNGVEVDIQMSLDGTIWMFHNGDLAGSGCNTNYRNSIILMKDTEIEKIQICYGKVQDKIYKLEELINLWNITAGGFVISMEVKLDYPSDTINHRLIGGEAAYLLKFANSLAKLFPTIKYPNQIMLEVYDAAFCNKIHTTLPGIKVCLIKAVTFPKLINDAIASGYDGVSCGINESTLSIEEVKRARDNGLIVQLWTPDNRDDLTKTFNLHPHYIQTNNLKAISLLNLKVVL